jgi:membrane-associated phospholipid phosphatase
MRLFIIFLLLFKIACIQANTDSTNVPFTKIFYGIGKHAVGSFTYNYGLNYVVGSIGTYGLVKSGIDWNINRYANNHKTVAYIGMAPVAISSMMPFVTPLAMVQSAILAATITSGIKVFTGRYPPGILASNGRTDDYSNDFKFGFLNRGAFNGWPSGHTATAFAMATTLCEIYPNNTTLKIGAMSYATLVGLSVSVNIHWFSDAFAGALIGYAIGKSVGLGFNKTLNNKQNNLSWYALPSGAGVVYNF